MSSSFGQFFRLHSFGESHGAALGCVVDGCPAGLLLDLDAVQAELDRRRPGQAGPASTARQERDRLELLSGVFEGKTLGTPIAMIVRNQDARSRDYDALREIYRPSHADFTTEARYGHRDHRGGGRASARETVARVLGGAIARQLLQRQGEVEVIAWVSEAGDFACSELSEDQITRAQVDAHPMRCPDLAAAARMEEQVRAARADRDSLGGVIRCVVRGLPAGLGEPVFDKLTATIAHGLMSLPASRGVEFGEGFAAAKMRGSEHNDAFELREGRVRTRSNHSGGLQGGISNGELLRLQVAFKPVATIGKAQDTVTRAGEALRFEAKGRHDACVLPRAVPLVEAMVCLALADAMLARAAGTLV